MGVSAWWGCLPGGGVCIGGVCIGGCLPGVSAQGVSAQGNVCPGGIYPGTCLPARRVSACWGVSAYQGVSGRDPLWTEFFTHPFENITFPQLHLRTVEISSRQYTGSRSQQVWLQMKSFFLSGGNSRLVH